MIRSSIGRIPSQQWHQRMRWFGSRRRRSMRRPSVRQENEGYWDKEYERSKEALSPKQKLLITEEKDLSDILSWKPLLAMAVAPLLLCMAVPEWRSKMLASFHLQNQTADR